MIDPYRKSKWTIILGVWTLLGLLFATQSYVYFGFTHRRLSWLALLLIELPFAYVWAGLTPLIFWLAERYRLGRQGWMRNLIIHLSISAFLAFMIRGSRNFMLETIFDPFNSPVSLSMLMRSVYTVFDYYMLIYWFILMFSHALSYQRRYNNEQLHSAQLEGQLAQAQLQALKMQLHPHFLFNTLNSISALQLKDIDAANKMLSRLGEFLRLTLENSRTQEASLQKEIEFLNRYLEIEHVRFQDRLSVHMQIEPEALDARVPYMILQPIVENAIRHGVSRRSSHGRIEIWAERKGAMLSLLVRDSGPGLKRELKEGLGLSNTRARLEQMYGERHRLELKNASGGGAEVLLEIPFARATRESNGAKGKPGWKTDRAYGH